MATSHWRTGYSVTDLYQKDDAGWSFQQLIRLLLPTGTSSNEILDQINQRVQFTNANDQDFPPGEIRSIELGRESHPKEKSKITCTHYNIAGLGGPLAEPFVDMLRDNKSHGDGSMEAFINIFNNRIQSLRYYLRAKNDNTLTSTLAASSESGEFILSLTGHLSREQRALHQQPDATLLGLAGDLANTRMTLPTIRKLLNVVMGLQLIEMNSLVGRWLTVDSCDHTHLGCTNHRLGGEATLGTKIWDQQAAIELVIGPVSSKRIQALIPDGKEHTSLRNLIEWICDKRYDCKITFICKDNLSRTASLSQQKTDKNLLSFGSWLAGKNDMEKRVSFMLDIAYQ